jgi:hypothetical protein
MLWTVIWCGDNRERFKRTVRQRFPRWPLPGDVGDLAASRFEEEVALHPLPSPELPQIMEDCVFAFGQICDLPHRRLARILGAALLYGR